MANTTTVFQLDEVAKHNRLGDLWIIIEGKVYDVSKFASVHPGGVPPFLDPTVAGHDATELFFGLHRASVLEEKRYARLQIGIVAGAATGTIQAKKKTLMPGEFAQESVPYGEALGTFRKFSPYYNESHLKLRAALRKFFDTEIMTECKSWDDNGTLPTAEVTKSMGDAGLFAALIASEEGAGPLLRQHGVSLPGGIEAEDYDYFHGLIFAEEMRRGTDWCPGVTDGLYGGMAIGLPPLLKFGSKHLIEKYAVPVIRGDSDSESPVFCHEIPTLCQIVCGNRIETRLCGRTIDLLTPRPTEPESRTETWAGEGGVHGSMTRGSGRSNEEGTPKKNE